MLTYTINEKQNVKKTAFSFLYNISFKKVYITLSLLLFPISNDASGLLKCALIITIIIRQAEARIDSLYTPYALTKSKSLKYILLYIVC